MARTAGGQPWIEAARTAVRQAESVHELRMAQAMLLPGEFGLSFAQVAAVIGQSVATVPRLRAEFARAQAGEELARTRRGGRRNAYLTLEQEAAVLQPFRERAASAGMVVVSEVKAAFERKLKRALPLSTVYRILHRHGWRKLAPDTRHPQGDPNAQEAWKKNSPNSSPKRSTPSRRRTPRFG